MNAAAAYKYDDSAPLPPATRLRLVTCVGYAANDDTYNTRNQLTAVADSANAANDAQYAFDPNGNQIRKTQDGSTTDFNYDVKDQLLSVSQNTANLGVFSYDYQGHRIVKDMGGSVVRYAYDGSSVLLETDNSGITQAKFDYGPDRLLSMNHISEGRAYYLFDALGSVSNLTTTAGGIQARYQYDAYGNYRNTAGASFNRFGFTGHEKDNETNLYYFKARFYDPETGRFLNQDAYLGDVNTPPSLHRYLYAYGNPTVYIDLTGYDSTTTMLDDSAMQAAKDDNSLKLAAIVTAQAGYKLADTITFGWIGKHDAARDKYDRGEISGEQYAIAAGKATLESGVYLGATVVTGGYGAMAAGAVGAGRAATIVTASATAGLGYQAADDVIKGEVSSAGTYAKTATIFAAGGVAARGGMALKESLGETTVSEGLSVVETKIRSITTGEGAGGGVRIADGEVARSVEAKSTPAPEVLPPPPPPKVDGGAAQVDQGVAANNSATIDRIRTVAQKGFDYAAENPRVDNLNRMQLGKDAEVQATRWMRRWAERNDVPLGEGELQFQVRGDKSVPDVAYHPDKTIIDFKLTPKAIRTAQSKNFATDFPGYDVEYIFSKGPWRK